MSFFKKDSAVPEVKAPDKFELAKQEYFNQPDGFPFGQFRLADVNLPPDEEAEALEEDDEEAVAQEVVATQDTGFGTCIAIDGLPVTTEDKFDKLEAMIKRKFEMHGKIKDGCLWMPKDEESGKSKGYAFIEYSKREEAHHAVQAMNDFQFDKAHKLKAYTIDELDRLAAVPEEYSAPERATFNEDMQAETMAWMVDSRGRDQFLIQHPGEHAVCWNDAKKGAAAPFFARAFWSDGPMSWSPQGTYAVTLHPQGAALWVSRASGQFERVARFACQGVQKVDFSPAEELLTCYSVQQKADAPVEVLMTVFDVRSSRKLRVLAESLPKLLVGRMRINSDRIVEPFLAWSPGAEPYAAKLAADTVQVYNGADMTLLDKRAITLEGVQDICWSPADNVLAAFQQEHGNLPARVALLSLPDKAELRQKNLFAVAGASLFWHPQGTYLAVHVDKYTKSKKSTYATIELFNLKNKANVTNDVLELAAKNDKVRQVAWEPKGDRFAVLHSDSPQRASVSFYTMLDRSAKDSTKLLGTISNRPISSVHWSPAGRVLVLAGLDSNAGSLEFFNVDDMATLRTQAHFLANNVSWDGSGRYVCSWVDDSRDMEHGFVMWSFAGELLYRCRYDSFWQFAWRPRPPLELPADVERAVAKNLKAYGKKYDEQDERLLAAADTEQMAARREKRLEWEAFLAGKAGWLAAQHAALVARLGHEPVEPKSELKEVAVQQVVDMKEEPFLP